MKINLDDPNLTAFALGELSGEAAAAIERAVADSADARAYVEETRVLAGLLRADFRADLRETKPRSIMPLAQPRSFWSDSRWLSTSVAALLAVVALLAAVLLSDRANNPRNLAAKKTGADLEVEMQFEPHGSAAAPSAGTAASGRGAGVFQAAAAHPISSLPLRAGSASYAKARAAIEAGVLPARDDVQVEELVNFFRYDYPPPQGDESFSIKLEIAACPWAPEHQLVRIGLRGRSLPGNENAVIARDVRAEVEFVPTRVQAWRLIGYEQQSAAGGDDGAEIKAGHTVTALYEVVPQLLGPGERAADSEEAPVLLSVAFHYVEPASGRNGAMRAAGRAVAVASDDQKFAAAVAEFGLILRGGDGSFDRVVAWASAGLGRDADGARAGFLEMVRKAQRLTNG